MTNRRLQNRVMLKSMSELKILMDSPPPPLVTQTVSSFQFIRGQVDPTALNIDYIRDGGYQREPIDRHWMNMADNFRLELCEELAVSRRADGSMWVISGQHRVLAARHAKIPSLAAKVFRNLTREQEAGLFKDYDTERRKVSAIDLYKAAVLAGRPVAVKLDTFLRERNYIVTDKVHGSNHIKCIAMLLEFIEEDPETLAIVFDRIITPIYNRDQSTYVTSFAVGGFYELYRILAYAQKEDPNVALLTDPMNKYWFRQQTGQTLRDRIFKNLKGVGGNRAFSCAEAIRANMNSGRQMDRRIPPLSKLPKAKK